MTALVLAHDGSPATQALRSAITAVRARRRRSEGGVAELIRERAMLSQRILANHGEPDLAAVARFQDVTRAIEAALIMFRARSHMHGASHVRSSRGGVS